jgi:hypothetical protein
MAKSQTFIFNQSLQSATTEINTLFKHPKTVLLLKISLIIVGFSWILYAIFYQFMPPAIPLFFSRPWGQNQLIAKNMFIILPASITLLFLINTRLASFLLKRDLLMAIVLLSAYVTCALIGFISIVRLMILLA